MDLCFSLSLYATGRVHIFRVALAVGLGIATVLLMDATNTSYFGWYRCAHIVSPWGQPHLRPGRFL